MQNVVPHTGRRFDRRTLSDSLVMLGVYHEYVAVCLEYPYRYARAPTAHEAIDSLEREIAEVVDDMVAAGSIPPESLTDRRYSGEFHVRTSPSLHSRLAVEATEQGVSLNQWVVQKLADRKALPSLDDLF